MDFKKKYLKYKAKYFNKTRIDYNKTRIDYIKKQSNILDSDLNNEEFFSKHDLNKLKIINDLKKIKENDYIELRPYNGEKKLLIGCGNTRLDCGNLDPCDNSEEKTKYDIFHSHEDVYTIDISLIANPSIVSYFNENITFPTIPDHSFDLIVFEGGGEPTSNPREIQRLLKNTTNTFCINMIDGKYNIYSYYLEGNYYIN